MTDNITWFTLVTIGVFTGFLLDWTVVFFGWQNVKLISKPLALSLVILWTLVQIETFTVMPALLLITAQVFGLAGDLFLLFPWRCFKWGLGAFLLGHLAYISILLMSIGDAIRLQKATFDLAMWVFICFGIWVVLVIIFYRVFSPGKILHSILKMPWKAVQVYAWVLTLMFSVSILMTRTQPVGIHYSWLILVGSSLFIISDSTLAYDRFIRKLKRGRLWVRVTYHLAQFSLAWGFVKLISVHKNL